MINDAARFRVRRAQKFREVTRSSSRQSSPPHCLSSGIIFGLVVVLEYVHSMSQTLQLRTVKAATSTKSPYARYLFPAFRPLRSTHHLHTPSQPAPPGIRAPAYPDAIHTAHPLLGLAFSVRTDMLVMRLLEVNPFGHVFVGIKIKLWTSLESLSALASHSDGSIYTDPQFST